MENKGKLIRTVKDWAVPQRRPCKFSRSSSKQMKVNHFTSIKSAIRSEDPQLSAKSPQPIEDW